MKLFHAPPFPPLQIISTLLIFIVNIIKYNIVMAREKQNKSSPLADYVRPELSYFQKYALNHE